MKSVKVLEGPRWPAVRSQAGLAMSGSFGDHPEAVKVAGPGSGEGEALCSVRHRVRHQRGALGKEGE